MINGVVKEGNILFLHSTEGDISRVRQYLSDNHSWDFNETKETKELNLTHNLIADKAGYRSLMNIYDGDLILAYRDRIRRYIKDKGILSDFSEKTFEEVIDYLKQGKAGRELTALNPTNSMQTFINNNIDLFNTALNYNYLLFAKIYVNKDQLLDDKKQDEDDENKRGSKRDNLIKHLFKIQTNITLYSNGRYNEFMKATDYRMKVTRIEDKKTLKENIENLIAVGDKTIEEVINDANEKGISLIDDKLEDFKIKNEYLYNRVKNVKFSEFQKLYSYLEGHTPFSTQHKTKGTEFNSVFVILDNGGWNNYNFENLFLGQGTASVLNRTQKIFYVCCTRAKEKLAVFYHNPSPNVVAKARDWFGNENVIDL